MATLAPSVKWTRPSAKLLDHLRETGQAENTIVVYTSDHGDYATEHGIMEKGARNMQRCNHPRAPDLVGAGADPRRRQHRR